MLDWLRRAFPTLARVRLVVQCLTFLLCVYGSLLVGHYAAQKISTALPALSCAYDGLNGGYCALVSLQHQMDHRVGAALARAQQVTAQILVPLFVTGDVRDPLLPEVPTAREVGIPDLTITGFFGLLAPAGTGVEDSVA